MRFNTLSSAPGDEKKLFHPLAKYSPKKSELCHYIDDILLIGLYKHEVTSMLEAWVRHMNFSGW